MRQPPVLTTMLLASVFPWMLACPGESPSDAGEPEAPVDGGEPEDADGGEPEVGADGGEPEVGADGGEPEVGDDGGEPEVGADGGQADDAGLSAVTCPAPEAPAGALVVYGEQIANGWEAYGFAGAFDDDTTNVCSGTVARTYTSQQYDGFAFETVSDDFAAGTLVARIYLDAPSYWAVAAVRPGEDDPHQFIGDEVWDAGWQTVEYEIPESTPTTRWILFEKQDEGETTIWIDDLWLLPR